MSVLEKDEKSLFGNARSTCHLLLLLLIFISDGECEVIELHCPVTFIEGAIQLVNCNINSTTVTAANCFPTPSVVQFTFDSASVSPYPLCLAPYNGACNQQPVGGMNCSCIKSDAGVQTYQFNFVANKTQHEGGRLKCVILCSTPLSYNSSDSCSSLKIDTTGSKGGSEPDLKVILPAVIVPTITIIVVIVIVIVVIKKKTTLQSITTAK